MPAPLPAPAADDQASLAEELIGGVLDRFDKEALTSVALCDQAIAWLDARVGALTAERSDELTFDLEQRDNDWLGESKLALKRANGLLHDVRAIRGRLAKAANIVASRAEDRDQFEAFKAVIKDQLGDAAYVAAWEEVYRRHPEMRRVRTSRRPKAVA